jgi:uncharacterized membrane protein (DUF4010 family)
MMPTKIKPIPGPKSQCMGGFDNVAAGELATAGQQAAFNVTLVELTNFKLLAIALAIGLLIGLERGWSARDKADGMRIAGLRTYGLLSLLGGLWAMLSQQTGPLLMGFAFLGLTAMLLAAYRGSLKKFEDFSITGSIASLITFSLGALTVFGHIALASATAVVMTSLLGFKPLLHGWINRIEQQELYATLKLLLISVVILPVLPDQGFGPWAAFNPYYIWWMVVLIAGISYLGYFAMKIVGNRHGPVLTGVFGGLVSSTVVTLNLSRLSSQYPNMQNALAAGILMACATMFARILLLTFILNPKLSQYLLPAFSVMCLLTLLMAFLLWFSLRSFRSDQTMKLENPFQLGTALKFAMLLAVVMLLTRLLKIYFGDMGTYLLAAVSGIVDADAITLSMAHLSKTSPELDAASHAILIAVFANTGFKCLMSWWLGDRTLALRVGGASIVAIAGGLIVS